MLRFLLLAVSLCAALIGPLALPQFFAPIINNLDDWRTRLSLRHHAESRIVIIDVDERSLAEQGPWPWPREKIARLLQALIDDYGVSGIAVDMVFPERRQNDLLLAAQMHRKELTGAVVFDLEQRNLPDLALRLPPTLPLQAAPGWPRISGRPVVANHAGIQTPRVGHITPIFDADGSVRRLPPLICSGNDCRPSLAIAAFAGISGGARLTVEAGRGLLAAPWYLAVRDESGAALVSLPVNDDGMLLVPYRHTKQDWVSVSATDVLEHKIKPTVLKGVLTLLGGTALGLADVVATPVSPVAAGLEPHAETFSALLDDDFAAVPRWGWLLDTLLLLPFAAVLGWSLRHVEHPLRRAMLFPTWLIATWTSSAACAFYALHSYNLLLPLDPFLLFPPIAVLLMVLAELYRTGNERAGIFSMLSIYLPKQVAARLATFGNRSTSVDAVDASRRRITVMFADIHGFAGLSEHQEPEIVARLMQRVFTEMAEAVVAHQGTIDKFIGDAIMAFWNAPEDDPEHAQHALATAKDMLGKMNALAPFCEELGLPPIHIGIGIDSGEALVGNFGSIHRRTFTALGDPVVLASRLEQLTKHHQTSMLIGEECAAELRYQGVRALGEVQIRGRVQPITLYVPEE
jgi:adenylate cyclase